MDTSISACEAPSREPSSAVPRLLTYSSCRVTNTLLLF